MPSGRHSGLCPNTPSSFCGQKIMMPTPLTVYINSGNVSAYHVNVGNPADPYDLIK
jgi:hypothetical protein